MPDNLLAAIRPETKAADRIAYESIDEVDGHREAINHCTRTRTHRDCG